jgi:hypothetical protein
MGRADRTLHWNTSQGIKEIGKMWRKIGPSPLLGSCFLKERHGRMSVNHDIGSLDGIRLGSIELPSPASLSHTRLSVRRKSPKLEPASVWI